jgi:hypothetical protein
MQQGSRQPYRWPRIQRRGRTRAPSGPKAENRKFNPDAHNYLATRSSSHIFSREDAETAVVLWMSGTPRIHHHSLSSLFSG